LGGQSGEAVERVREMRRVKLTHILFRDVRGTPMRGPNLSKREMRSGVFRILKENVLCSIATVTGKNRAHINTAYFCYSDDLELSFLSHPDSLHCRNVLSRPVIAMTVFSSSQPWSSPGRGLQVFGRCGQATGIHARRAEHLYGKRFPRYARWRASLKKADAGGEYRFYRLVVSTLKIFDERVFGDAVFGCATVMRDGREK
jgi:uncharacterized protein YhbP (UPF0306 family)